MRSMTSSASMLGNIGVVDRWDLLHALARTAVCAELEIGEGA
jgi:hypothetical protein